MTLENCPQLSRHLNNLSGGTDEQKALGFHLVIILDAVENIANLMDNSRPAIPHSLAHAASILAAARRAETIILELATS